MKFAALIPARLESSRFPGKLLELIGDKPIIQHVYNNTLATGLFDLVAVVTNHETIFDAIVSAGGKAFMSKKTHENGTDRIAEISSELDHDVVFNIQGDEPFVDKNTLEKLKNIFLNNSGRQCSIASPMTEITDPAQIDNPNVVKVVTDLNDNAMYFSRSRIPYLRADDVTPTYYRHIGIYAFKRQSLLEVTALSPTTLESSEMIECIRYLEHGIPIRMVRTNPQGVSIDTLEDLVKARDFYQRMINKP